jgi:hypothetical protein
MTATKTPTKVEKGLKFRYGHADGNPLWEVKRKLGGGSWLCVILNERFEHDGRMYDSDYAGTEKAFLEREIIGSIGLSAMFDTMRDEGEAWYDSLKVGQTVHYHNGFKQYVRCVVVKGRDVHLAKDAPDRNVLKATALVGEWRDYDLPKRGDDGEVIPGHYADMVIKGETFRPNASNVYEYTKYGRKTDPDPAKMKPLDLTPPGMTKDQEEAARLWKIVEQVYAAIQLSDDEQKTLGDIRTRRKPSTPKLLLQRAYDILKAELK